MKIRHLLATMAIAVLTVHVPAVEPGEPAPAWTLTDHTGIEHSLSDFAGKVVVLEWTNPGCPFVVDIYTRGVSKKIAAALEGQDVVYILVNSTSSSHQDYRTPEQVAEWFGNHGVSFPVLMDETGAVGRAYGAATTPHVFVIDGEGVVRYNGAIDNNQMNRNADNVTSYTLDAVRAVLAGEEVATPRTRPWGCSVKYGAPVAQAAPAQDGVMSLATGTTGAAETVAAAGSCGTASASACGGEKKTSCCSAQAE